MPRFSIGLPCKAVVSETVQSVSTIVVAAIQEDTEIIIGVQDFTASESHLIDYLSNQPRVRILDTSSASNLSGTLNLIIDSCQSRYFVRTDDDDFMHPLRIRKLREAFDQDSNMAIIGQAYKSFYGKQVSSLMTPSTCSLTNKIKLLLGVPFAHPAITLDLMKIGTKPYDENQTFAQDYMLYVDMIKTGRYCGNGSIATYYRIPQIVSDIQKRKRQIQLLNHEMAMKKIWNLVSECSYSDYEIHLLRCCLVTDEYADDDCKDYRNWCYSCLANATSRLREYIGFD